MAKTAAHRKHAASGAPTNLAGKAASVGQLVAQLRSDVAQAHALTHQAQVREALTRTELTLALGEALIARAEAQATARRAAADLYFIRTARRPLPAPIEAKRLEKLLSQGPAGEAQIIAEGGVWQGDDRAEIADYARRGADPAARPKTLFDQAAYLAAYQPAGCSPLVHYLLEGGKAGAWPHPLFDPEFYRLRNAADCDFSQVTPLQHFLSVGAATGRDPHPLFDVVHYAGQSPSVAAGEDPVSHYLREGWRTGLTPHPLFDPAWYRRRMPHLAGETPPLLHYVIEGWRAGLSPHPLFDIGWYLEHAPDVADAGLDPLAHFVAAGAAEGRSPGPWFDVPHYLAARGAALAPGANPLVDYLQGGAWAVAEARPGFPTAAYLARSPELVAQGMTPLEHWARAAAN